MWAVKGMMFIYSFFKVELSLTGETPLLDQGKRHANDPIPKCLQVISLVK